MGVRGRGSAGACCRVALHPALTRQPLDRRGFLPPACQVWRGPLLRRDHVRRPKPALLLRASPRLDRVLRRFRGGAAIPERRPRSGARLRHVRARPTARGPSCRNRGSAPRGCLRVPRPLLAGSTELRAPGPSHCAVVPMPLSPAGSLERLVGGGVRGRDHLSLHPCVRLFVLVAQVAFLAVKVVRWPEDPRRRRPELVRRAVVTAVPVALPFRGSSFSRAISATRSKGRRTPSSAGSAHRPCVIFPERSRATRAQPSRSPSCWPSRSAPPCSQLVDIPAQSGKPSSRRWGATCWTTVEWCCSRSGSRLRTFTRRHCRLSRGAHRLFDPDGRLLGQDRGVAGRDGVPRLERATQ